MENESNSASKTTANSANGIANGLNKIRRIITICSIGGGIPFLIIVIIIAVLIVIGIIDIGTGTSIAQNGECGFTISTTSLTKTEYKSKIETYAQTDSNAKVFAENADSIYDLAVSSNINPELVVIRAAAEGYDPGSEKNNYWGLGCTNTGGESACISYDSFMDGVAAYISNISQYSSLIEMMQSYSYIGDNWIWPPEEEKWSAGGCPYYESIKDYYDTSSEAQASKQAAEEACSAGGTGIKTTQYDQNAYASWQVNANMNTFRKKIFGLTDENTACTISDSNMSVSVTELINLSDADAWNLIAGLNHEPSPSETSESKMDARMTTIKVPYRTWAKSGDSSIGTVGGNNVTKKEATLTVNKAVADLSKEFFTDVYNNAPNFVIRSFDGCYNYRKTTGGSSLSAHAFGVACDINASTKGNGYGKTSYTTWAEVNANVSGKAKYEVVYKESEIMKIAHKYTITNGSDWSNPNDAMHFSFIGDKTRAQTKKICGIN